jgi:hypothetical protein
LLAHFEKLILLDALILQLYFTVLSYAAANGTSLQWLGDAAARATNQ